MANFNWVDYVVLGICFFSTATGLLRGLVREVLSLITWVLAFLLASTFAARLAAVFSSGNDANQSGMVTDLTNATVAQPLSYVSISISFIAIFIVVLLLGKILTYLVSGVTEGGFSGVNRFLGGIFGFGRGILMVLVAIFLANLSPISAEPYWKKSYFVNLSAPTIEKMNGFVAPQMESLKERMGRSLGLNNLDNDGLTKIAEVLERTV